jgi:hypothetical protein
MSDEKTDALQTAAGILRKMAERCDTNAGEGFGGVMVIIPPTGNPVEVLVLDPKQNAAQFWGIVQTQSTISLKEIEDAERVAGAYGRR